MRSITDIDGVYAGSLSCGIRKGRRPDLAFIYLPKAVVVAGVFTQNLFRAPCVEHNCVAIASGSIRAIVANSGIANACTGEQGILNVRRTAELAADLLGIIPSEVAVASTGLIGKQLPMDLLEDGLKKLLADPFRKDGAAAAEAIMTTDTRAKHVFLESDGSAQVVRVAGIAKGSGMIAPNMATMLAFLVTDAALPKQDFQRALTTAVQSSFNMVSVDGDTSTNDMVLLLSTGDVELQPGSHAANCFESLLSESCIDLAKQIAADGEGASKLIEVQVEGAPTLKDARAAAQAVVRSPLVKTAIHGADPNWGRVIAALGYSSASIVPERLELYFGAEKVYAEGVAVDVSRARLKEELSSQKVFIRVNLNCGSHKATAWGCDLTAEYVSINTEYN